MAAIDGIWETTTKTPMGDQTATMTITSSGDSFTGTTAGAMGSTELKDGRIDGNKAVATCHSQLVIKDPENPTGFKVLRITANRWELIKTDGEWKVELRTNALLDGRPEARALLAAGVTA